VGLLDLVEKHDRIGPAAHGLGQLAALVVADVAGRGADEARHRVLLHVLRHVDAHHVGLVVEQELGQRPRQLGLAHAGGPEKNERADGPVGILQARARPANRIGDGLHRRVLADDPLVQALFHVAQAGLLAFQHFLDGNAGPLGHHGRDVFLGHFLAQERAPGLVRLQLLVLRRELLFQLGQAAETQLGGAIEVALPLRQLRFGLGALDVFLDLLNLPDDLLLTLPDQLHGRRLFAQLGDFGFDLGQALARRLVVLFGQGGLLHQVPVSLRST
jgi:hypothetical protein